MINLMLEPKVLPFPYFLVDQELKILQASNSVHHFFPTIGNFLEVVDSGSIEKARRFILETPSIHKVELNLHTIEKPFALHDVYVHYETPQRIHSFCINKEEQIDRIKDLVSELEETLININFSLLEKKMSLEHSLEKVKQAALEHDNLVTVGKLAASVAHEIRNPLTSVRGFVQLLRPYLIDIGKEEYADIAISELDRANDIIYEFLNASKPSKPAVERVLLNDIIDEVLLLSESESILNNCQLNYAKPNIAFLIYADAKQLKQVLLNLIKNAMDAIVESAKQSAGIISIEVINFQHYVEIVVADNGIGIPEENMVKLFTPFFTTKEKGTGVGLAVCKRIIAEHKGSITVESRYGEGTKFKVVLPKIAEGMQ
jgi:signal transduction histidine kinase